MKWWPPSFFEKKSLASPDPWLFDLFGAVATASGRSVTPVSAMRCAAVSCAVGQISEAIATMPCFVFERGDDDSRERAREHPAYRIVHTDASEFVSAPAFRQQLVVDALLTGNGVGMVGRVDGGKPFECIRLKPEAVSITEDDRTGDPVFKLNMKSGQRTLARRDVIHVPALSIDGVKGVAPIANAKEAIALSLTLEEHAARLFASGARPGGILSTEKNLGENALTNIRKIFEAQNSGASNAGRTMLLPDGFKFSIMALTSVDAQFEQLRAAQVAEISRAFKIPPVFLQDFGRATWGNSEVMARLFLTYTLAPWIERIESAFRHALIDRDDREKYYIEISTDSLLKADLQARATAYQTMIAARVLNPNEARAAENRPPYEGGDKFENPNTTAAPAAAGAA